MLTSIAITATLFCSRSRWPGQPWELQQLSYPLLSVPTVDRTTQVRLQRRSITALGHIIPGCGFAAIITAMGNGSRDTGAVAGKD